MNIIRGFLPSIFQVRSIPTDRPSLALPTMTAHSAARIAHTASPEKSKLPGASMTLIFLPLYCTGAKAREMDIWRLISSAS